MEDAGIMSSEERQALFELRARHYAARRLGVPDADEVVAKLMEILARRALDPSAGEVDRGVPVLALSAALLQKHVEASDKLAQRRGGDPKRPGEAWWAQLRAYASGELRGVERARFELHTLQDEACFEWLMPALRVVRSGEAESAAELSPPRAKTQLSRWIAIGVVFVLILLLILWVVLVEP